jgi:hypothetical protein
LKEWEESIVQSHQDSGGNNKNVELLVENHNKNVKYIGKTFQSLLSKLDVSFISLQVFSANANYYCCFFTIIGGFD